MGIVYKIKPEIHEFVLEQKRQDANLSCRGLAFLVKGKFQADISKSSINSILKAAGLSLPVGRRLKERKKRFNMPVLPALEQDKPKLEIGYKQLPVLEVKAHLPEKDALVSQPAVEDFKKQEAERASLEFQRMKAEEEKARIDSEKTVACEEKLAEKLRREEERLAEEKKIQEQAFDAEKEKWAKIAEVERQRREKAMEASALTKSALFELPLSRDTNGIILLKAVDTLVQGSFQTAEVIKKKIDIKIDEVSALTESLFYLSLFKQAGKDTLDRLWSVLGKGLDYVKVEEFIGQLNSAKTIKLDLARAMANVFEEARGIKVHFIDSTSLYLDAQLHTVWSTPYTPFGFSSNIWSVKSYINEHLLKDQPLALFMAPGYDMPTKEFFSFIQAFDSDANSPDLLTLYGNKLEELGNIPLGSIKNRALIFGLWPWQFVRYRKVRKIGEYKNVHSLALDREIYIADIEIEISNLSVSRPTVFTGCALKFDLAEKARLVILGNSLAVNSGIEELADLYFNAWPNLEEGFQDYSRKIELFTYTANLQRFFSSQPLNAAQHPALSEEPVRASAQHPALSDRPVRASAQEKATELEGVFENFLKLADMYLRWHFLPAEYEDLSFSAAKERFYDLDARIDDHPRRTLVTFRPGPGYLFLKDLQYLCRRLNEREIRLFLGKKSWFGIA